MGFSTEAAMSLAISRVPVPANEPVLGYAPGTPERTRLQAMLARMSGERTEMPLVIDGRDVRTGRLGQAVMPHRHAHVLGDFHQGGAAEARSAIVAALRARVGWAALPWEARAAVFL
jgi:1-pyrroline-5-carboxylate dehydrogenase